MKQEENNYIFHFSSSGYIPMFKMQLREIQEANNFSIPSNLYRREQCQYTAILEVMMP